MTLSGNSHFICTVGPEPNTYKDVFVQLGDVANGLTVTMILTPIEAVQLSRNLLEAAEAAQQGKPYYNTEEGNG